MSRRKTKSIRISLKLLFVLMLLLFSCLQIVYTIHISSGGSKLASLEEEYLELSSKNEELTRYVVSKMSLNSLLESSQNLGFSKPSKIIYISESDAFASLR